ncbi:unnamed protein product [Psylliodes chrysocephalus]|uniref:Cc8L18.2-like protein n=1 Tax=Psylliodes chrysocephalus TaxID=3402493 RepID=A0A9P0CR02_9CUCU|nr:unnamed protein product [Psylliodes chrysocephala]
MENKKCSIGLFKDEICSEEKFIDCKNFSDEDQIALNSRSGTEVSFICSEHDKRYRINYTSNQRACADPFNLHDSRVRKSLRPVSLKLFKQCKVSVPSIIPGSKLCISCTKRVYSELPEHQNIVKTVEKTVNIEKSQAVESVSEDSVFKSSKPSETPGQRKDLDRSKTYAQRKYHDMTSKLQSCFEHLMENDSDIIKNKQLNIDDTPKLIGKEIISQLKEKYNNCSKVSEKLHILSILPLSWSTEKIVDAFGASTYMVKKVKQKVSEDGILFTPQRNKGHSLLKSTEEKIQQFYRNQDVSRELPGKKEYKSVHENGQRVQKQKRLILGNLNEIYQLFKQKYPFEKVSFSKFASLRPPECVLAGSSGTHVVCVCLIHENFKLSFHGAKLDKLKYNDESQPAFSSYRDCLKMIICPQPTSDCYLGTCNNLTHNTTAVYSFQEVLTSFLKDKIPNISKIIYFSDGAASQYKNRYNLLNLLHHEDDFQIPAEWHFFATSHGKGPSDGLGGALKRKVDRANLQSKAEDQIQTPDELFQWAKEHVHGICCHFVSNEQIQRTQKKLNQRFKNALPVQGIRNCHAAIPISSDVIRVKTLSSSEQGQDFRLKNTDIYEFVEEPDIKSRLRKRKGATTVQGGLKKKRLS